MLHGADLDTDPSGLDDDIGTEWDLVLAYEPKRWFEMKLAGGRFLPGVAFRDPTLTDPQPQEPFDVMRFETRFRF